MPVGNHVSKDGKSMDEAILQAIELAKANGVNMKCCQIFVIGPRNAKETLCELEIARIRDIVSDSGLKLFVHGSYLDNPWGKKSAFAIHLIKRELAICDELGAAGLVIHLPRKSPTEISELLPTLLENKPKTPLYLEIESYKSMEYTYETIDKITALWEKVKPISERIDATIGICVDSAHLWAAGTDVKGYYAADNFMTKVCDTIDNVMVHLNDQINACGSGKDEHAPLAFGTIWADYHPDSGNATQSGLAAFLDYAETKDICCILERKSDKPKINGRPTISNIESDYIVINKMGYHG